MLYHIRGYSPEPGMGQSGFNVILFPAWKDALAAYEPQLTQEQANRAVENMGRQWLDGHGFDRMYDPDAGPFDSEKKLGPNARKLWEPRTSLRVSWGEWGPEHITVPGNACGLDLDQSGMWAPRGGKVLTPHNVDSPMQASLILTVFLFFADTLVLNHEIKNKE